MFKLYSRNKGLLVEQHPLITPDGRWFSHKGVWHPVPQGAAEDMIQGNTRWHNDFAGPTGTNDTFFQGTRGGSAYVVASGATLGVLNINGGAGRITIAGDESDAVAVYGPLAYEPDEARRIIMQVRLRTSNVDTGADLGASLFIGFTDALTDTVIIEDEDGTLNTVATDAFGVLLETEQDTTYQTVGVGNGVDDAQAAFTNQIADVAASEWHTLHIEADSGGNAARTTVRYRVRLDGLILKTAATTVDGWTSSVARSSIVYTPVVSVDDRNAAYTVDIAEMAADGGVGASFD